MAQDTPASGVVTDGRCTVQGTPVTQPEDGEGGAAKEVGRERFPKKALVGGLHVVRRLACRKGGVSVCTARERGAAN